MIRLSRGKKCLHYKEGKLLSIFTLHMYLHNYIIYVEDERATRHRCIEERFSYCTLWPFFLLAKKSLNGLWCDVKYYTAAAVSSPRVRRGGVKIHPEDTNWSISRDPTVLIVFLAPRPGPYCEPFRFSMIIVISTYITLAFQAKCLGFNSGAG